MTDKTRGLLTPADLHPYQREAELHALYTDETMLWLQMGLGKTIISLSVITDRMRAGQVKKTLIFGPLRVVRAVWQKEARKWTHTKDLRFSFLLGSPEKRRRALFVEADIYLCNYENMNWLAEELDHFYLSRGLPIPFDMVVYDEITKVKKSTSVRIAGGKRIHKDRRTKKEVEVHRIGWRKFIDLFKYRMGLTGTPASNGYKDLHGQYLVLDGGKRLGRYVTHFEDNFFTKGYDGWSIEVTELGRKEIEARIADITLKMDAHEYLPYMPKCTTSNIYVELPPSALKKYRSMEQQMFAELDSGKEVEVFTRSSAAMKCLQIANGSVYTTVLEVDYSQEHTAEPVEKTEWHEIHKAKLDALEEIIDSAAGAPVLVAYSFKSDAARIMQRFSKLNPVNLSTEKDSRTEKIIRDWNDGKIPLMIGHPASMGHGIDGLQERGSIAVWFGPTRDLELYDQFNSRLNRQGQTKPVSILRILAEDTIDLAAVAALEAKATDEAGLKKAIDAYRRRKGEGADFLETAPRDIMRQTGNISFL